MTFDLCGSRNFREQLAVPNETPNHHAEMESKAETLCKGFFQPYISMYDSALATNRARVRTR